MSLRADILERLGEETIESDLDESIQARSRSEYSDSLDVVFIRTFDSGSEYLHNDVKLVVYPANTRVPSVESLPAEVQNKLDTYLANWLGKDYKSILTFKRGYVFDIEYLHLRYPEILNDQLEIPKYFISYCVNITSVMPCYVAGLEMSGDGTILKDINLPPLSIHRDRLKLLSKAEVFKIAQKQNFYPNIPFYENQDFSSTNGLGYSRRAERFLYSFHKTTERGSGDGAVTTFYYDAQTGKYWGYAISRWIN